MAIDTATPANMELTTATDSSVLHRGLLIGFFAYLAFVIYGSLVPLQYIPISFEQALQQFSQIRYLNLGIESRADWVANILLFVPLSFLLAAIGFKASSPMRNMLLALLILSASFGLAIAIEFTQLYFPQRTVSMNDIIAESLGAVAGLLLFAVYGSHFKRFVLGFAAARGKTSLQFYWLLSYSALFFIYQVLPLDLTLSPVELYRKWQDGRVVLLPFSSLSHHPLEMLYAIISDIGLWLPITLLWLAHKPKQHRFAFYGNIILVAVTVEFCQLFVYSRITDVSDILYAAIAAFISRLMMKHWHPQLTVNSTSVEGELNRRQHWLLWTVVIIGYSLCVLAVFWYPFDFNFERGFVYSRWQELQTKVLFQNMYFGSEYRALTALAQKLLIFIPLGVLFAAMSLRLHAQWQRQTLWFFFAVYLCGLAGLVEAGQLALPAKSPDLTDWLLQVVAGIAGFKGYIFFVGRSVPIPVKASELNIAEKSSASVAHVSSVATTQPAVIIVLHLLITLLLLFVGSHLPMLPYNIRELLTDNNTALFGLAAMFYIMMLPLLLTAFDFIRFSLSLVPVVVGQSCAIFFCLYFTVPIESIHDILGAPVTTLTPSLELMLRFCGLFGLVQFSCLIAGRWLLETRSLPVVIVWFAYGMAFALIWYLVVVRWADTDNITELLAGGGGYAVAVGLAIYLGLLFGAAAWLARFIVMPTKQQFAPLLMVLLVTFGLSWVLINQITESVILKYGQAFSALQFLLSSDRAHYATPDQLFIRYLIGYAALLLILIWFYGLLALKLRWQWSGRFSR